MRCHFWTTLKVVWFQTGPSSLIALFVILKQLSPNFQKKLSSSSHEVKQPQKQQDKTPKHLMETGKHTNIYNNIPSLCNEKKPQNFYSLHEINRKCEKGSWLFSKHALKGRTVSRKKRSYLPSSKSCQYQLFLIIMQWRKFSHFTKWTPLLTFIPQSLLFPSTNTLSLQQILYELKMWILCLKKFVGLFGVFFIFNMK